MRAKKINICIDCGADISKKVSWAKYCHDCIKSHRKKQTATYHRNWYLKNIVEVHVGSICVECGIFVLWKHKFRLYCEQCSKKKKAMRNLNHFLIGTVLLSQHRKLNFEREYQIIHRELINCGLRSEKSWTKNEHYAEINK